MNPESARQAFALLAPVSPDYATLPILDGFNWSDCVPQLDHGSWYLVVFRSVRHPAADERLLEAYDHGAWREAMQTSPSLLHYFRGVTSMRRECLSFCIWDDREKARAISGLPLHRAAMRIVDRMYSSFQLERYTLKKVPGVNQMQVEAIVDDTPAALRWEQPIPA